MITFAVGFVTKCMLLGHCVYRGGSMGSDCASMGSDGCVYFWGKTVECVKFLLNQ